MNVPIQQIRKHFEACREADAKMKDQMTRKESRDVACLMSLAVEAEIASRELGTPEARLMAKRINWATVAAGYFFDGVQEIKDMDALPLDALKMFEGGLAAMIKLVDSYKGEIAPKSNG